MTNMTPAVNPPNMQEQANTTQVTPAAEEDEAAHIASSVVGIPVKSDVADIQSAKAESPAAASIEASIEESYLHHPSNNYGPSNISLVSNSAGTGNASRDSSPASRSLFQYPSHNELLHFLQSEEVSKCIKGGAADFCRWLIESQEITSLIDLSEAVSEDEYLNDDLRLGLGLVGLKVFKLKTFRRLVLEEV